MRENLIVTHYRNGDSIPYVTSDSIWANAEEGMYCFSANSTFSVKEHRVYFNWYAVNDNRGLCPSGWHVPSLKEFDILLGIKDFTEEKVISPYFSDGHGGYDGAYRDVDGSFYGFDSYFWTSTQYNTGNAYCKHV